MVLHSSSSDADLLSELEKVKKGSKAKQQDKTAPRRPSALMAGKDKARYTNIATAVRWLVNRPDAQDPQLALAQKLVRAARNTPSQGSSSGMQTPTSGQFKINQAQRKKHIFFSSSSQELNFQFH